MKGETPPEEERGLMRALRLSARETVAQAQQDGRLGRRLARDREEGEERLPDEQRRQNLQGGARPDPRRPDPERPTERELQVIGCLSHGLTGPEAGDVLGLAEFTIRDTLKRARQVTATKTSTHLVAVCLRQGWLT